MTEPFYVAVKASLHATDSSVFGLTPEEVTALSKRYPDSNKEVINGVLIKASPLKVINSLSELGYRVVCSSGEAEIVWTLRREVLGTFGYPESDEVSNLSKTKSLGKYEKENKNIPNELPSNSLEKYEKENKNIPLELTKHVSRREKENQNKLGTKPEDFAEFSIYKGSTILIKNPSSLSVIELPQKVTINTNEPSPENNLVYPSPSYKPASKYQEMDHHSAPRAIPSLYQTLDEMDFERGIWAPAMAGDLTRVRYHLTRGVPVDVEDNSGYTALHYAARNGHGHICTALLDIGAGVNKATRAGGATALHRAAMAGHADTCDVLLRYGANPIAKDLDGRTPLHRAVECGQKSVILLLLERFPCAAFEKDIKEKTPLDYAQESPSLTRFFEDLSNKIG